MSSLRRASALFLAVTTTFVAACSLSEPSEDGDDDDGGAGSAQAGAGAAGTPATGGKSGSAGSSGSNTSGAGGSSGAGGANGGSSGASAGAGMGGSSAGTTSGSSGSAGATAGSGTAGSSGSNGQAGSAGASGAGTAGSAGAAGSDGSGGTMGGGELGSGMMTGMGRSTEQYETAMIARNEQPYILITNGWGPGFESHTVSWNGTSFIVEAMSGTPGSSGQPASYPTVFCGRYSVMQVPDCGLPATIDSITTLKTGWRWKANDNVGQYNAAYDIWLGTETGFGMYLMVWLRDPPGQQPAGSPNAMHQAVTVANVPGVWDIWDGSVNNRPIINWVRREGTDSPEIEFDVMDFIRDAQMRGLTITGDRVNAVAVGFEIWAGPVTNLESVDFYVDVN